MPDPSYVGRRPTTPELFASHGAGLHVCSMTIVPDLVQLWQRNTELRESMNGGASPGAASLLMRSIGDVSP